jgi:hypothetical protein
MYTRQLANYRHYFVVTKTVVGENNAACKLQLTAAEGLTSERISFTGIHLTMIARRFTWIITLKSFAIVVFVIDGKSSARNS